MTTMTMMMMTTTGKAEQWRCQPAGEQAQPEDTESTIVAVEAPSEARMTTMRQR